MWIQNKVSGRAPSGAACPSPNECVHRGRGVPSLREVTVTGCASPFGPLAPVQRSVSPSSFQETGLSHGIRRVSKTRFSCNHVACSVLQLTSCTYFGFWWKRWNTVGSDPEKEFQWSSSDWPHSCSSFGRSGEHGRGSRSPQTGRWLVALSGRRAEFVPPHFQTHACSVLAAHWAP